ncbi:MAG: hypothetical protein K9M45_03670 [Kiritimatiellales bacterium]|nr:hypothetical protein [Kiritimatiellales bacterium]
MYTTIARRWIAVLVLMVIPAIVSAADDGLTEYYEAQKAKLLTEFKAPEIDSSITITFATKNTRTGILKELSADSVTIQTEVAPITYPKTALDMRTRTILFAEDYAHIYAAHKTRQIKRQNYAAMKAVDREQNVEVFHCARLNIYDNLDKQLDTKSAKNTREATETQTYNLDITLTNPTPHDDTYTLEWYFFSRSLGKSKGEPKISDKGSKEFTVAAQKNIKYTVLSKPVVNKESKKSSSRNNNSNRGSGNSKKTVSGTEYCSYVVLVRHNGEIIAKESNQRALLKDDNLANLSGKMQLASGGGSGDSSAKKSTSKKKKKKK